MSEALTMVGVFLATVVGVVAVASLGLAYTSFRSSPQAQAYAKLVATMESLRKELRSGINALKRVDKALTTATRSYEMDRREAAIRSVTLADLREYGAKGVRFKGLKDRGIYNLAQLRGRLHNLEAYEGIATKSAERIRHAVKNAERDISGRPLPMPSKDLSDRAALELARAACERHLVWSRAEKPLVQLEVLNRELQEELGAVRPSFYRFVRKQEDDRLPSKIAELNDRLEQRLQNIATERLRIPVMSDDQVRTFYAEEQAVIRSLIKEWMAGVPRRFKNRRSITPEKVEHEPLAGPPAPTSMGGSRPSVKQPVARSETPKVARVQKMKAVAQPPSADSPAPPAERSTSDRATDSPARSVEKSTLDRATSELSTVDDAPTKKFIPSTGAPVDAVGSKVEANGDSTKPDVTEDITGSKWVAALFETDSFRRALDASRISEEMLKGLLEAVGEDDGRCDVGTLADRLETSNGRVLRLLSASERLLNTEVQLIRVDRREGVVELDIRELCRAFGLTS